MSDRRIDRIEQLLKARGSRARIQELLQDLRIKDDNPDLPTQSIYIAIQQENERLKELGERARFVTSREGEDRGWVRLRQSTEITSGSEAKTIEGSIKQQNQRVDEAIRGWLKGMDWRIFESTFLTKVLESLGFLDVEITPPTRDGGADARVKYRRGIVEARAIISAKRWTTRTVSVEEVRQLRGIKGDEDTAIIVTTGEFSKDAKEEALPGQNQRIVYLIDGNALVDICKRHQIGVKRASLPDLLVLDPEVQSDPSPRNDMNESYSSDSGDSDDLIEANGLRRLRDEMLGDSDKGLSAKEIADLTKYSLNTVRNYLCDERRRKVLGDAIRDNQQTRARALNIVSQKRKKHASE